MVEPDKQPHADEPSQDPATNSIGTVTQLTPDDVLIARGPIAPTGKNDPVSDEKVVEDVVTINPTAESMESRG
ncbi:hypothetical protein [Alistipes sp.]|uniref:hypothetical protein n=1 Tax=Alistipes sp. TaxID=1872444 RepID=UPI003AEF1F47